LPSGCKEGPSGCKSGVGSRVVWGQEWCGVKRGVGTLAEWVQVAKSGVGSRVFFGWGMCWRKGSSSFKLCLDLCLTRHVSIVLPKGRCDVPTYHSLHGCTESATHFDVCIHIHAHKTQNYTHAHTKTCTDTHTNRSILEHRNAKTRTNTRTNNYI